MSFAHTGNAVIFYHEVLKEQDTWIRRELNSISKMDRLAGPITVADQIQPTAKVRISLMES